MRKVAVWNSGFFVHKSVTDKHIVTSEEEGVQ